MRLRVRSERFTRLLEVLESAPAPPSRPVRFRHGNARPGLCRGGARQGCGSRLHLATIQADWLARFAARSHRSAPVTHGCRIAYGIPGLLRDAGGPDSTVAQRDCRATGSNSNPANRLRLARLNSVPWYGCCSTNGNHGRCHSTSAESGEHHGRSTSISAVLADIDGTMVTKDKVLTERTILAVSRLRERGIVFTICSGRPPRGLRMLVEPLGLTMPMAAFNGGVIVLPDLSVLDERALPDYVVPAIVEAIQAHGLDVWIYSATDWYVRSPSGPARRSRGVDQSVRAHRGGDVRRRAQRRRQDGRRQRRPRQSRRV